MIQFVVCYRPIDSPFWDIEYFVDLKDAKIFCRKCLKAGLISFIQKYVA